MSFVQFDIFSNDYPAAFCVFRIDVSKSTDSGVTSGPEQSNAAIVARLEPEENIMPIPARTMACGVVALLMTSGSAFAGHFHHRYHVSHYRPQAAYSRGVYGYAPQAAYGGANSDAEIIRQATARAYSEPGVTLELAPDAKETATGGPSGGVPGFDGS